MSKEEQVINELAEKIKTGAIQPWKVESTLLEEYGFSSPDHYRIAALSRRHFIEEQTGLNFKYLELPEKPYLQQWSCPKDNSIWLLEARDEDRDCVYCGAKLETHIEGAKGYMPLANNYIGGKEEYYSFGGRINVSGDVNKTFTNVLAYGPGAGILGISVGCFRINKLGGADIKVGNWAGAARNLGYIFNSEDEREKAISAIKKALPGIHKVMEEKHLADFEGQVYEMEYVRRQHHGQYFLYVCFYTRFEHARGHAVTSMAVGYARARLDEALTEKSINFAHSFIAMGFDGDLKPAPRNRRGRYVSAQVGLTISAWEKMSKTSIDSLLSYMEMDRQGALQEQGTFVYSGMGGEIIPALYRGTKVNPRPYNVSCTLNVYTEIRGNELIFGVELPNVEVGAGSTKEGLVCPASREVLKFMGITNSKEFAAAAAALTLAGEFNFALLHLRGEMYASS